MIFKKEAGVLEYDLFFQEVKISSFQLIILCQTKHIKSELHLKSDLVSLEDSQDFIPNFTLDIEHGAG